MTTNESGTGATVQSPIPVESVILLSRIGDQLARNKFLLALIFVVTLSAVVGMSFLITPTYKSDTLIKVVSASDDKGQLSILAEQFAPLASLGGIELGGEDSKDEYLAILKSRVFTHKFINDNNLMPILYEERWDSANKQWKVSDSEDPPTITDAYKYFNTDIRKISEDRKSGLITLTIEWKDRHLAAQWANQLVALLNEEMRKQSIDEATKSIAYLESQLEQTSIVDLQRGMVRLIEGHLNRITLAKGRDDFVFKVIDPAIATDEDDVFKPDRRIWILGGIIVSVVLALAVVILLDFFRVLGSKRTRRDPV